MNIKATLQRIAAGRTFRNKKGSIQGGWAALRYWRNWASLALELNTTTFAIVIGPVWFDWWWAPQRGF